MFENKANKNYFVDPIIPQYPHTAYCNILSNWSTCALSGKTHLKTISTLRYCCKLQTYQ